ncbi:MAG: FHA domain-containing protein, partial [bacterium]
MASSGREGRAIPGTGVALRVRNGPLRGQSFPVPTTHALLIGRAPSNHIVLPHRHVSANHCLLAPQGPGEGLALIDARSRLGTQVNRREVIKGTVGLGDVITIGPVELDLVQTPPGQRPASPARPSADHAPRVDLLALDDQELVEPLPPASATLVGRGHLAHVSVDDPFVSTFHCLIALDPLDDDRRPFVIDLHSQNGTHVNGRSIHRKHMRLSDVLTVGRVQFTLRLHEEGWPATPEPELEAPPPEEPKRAATTLVLTPEQEAEEPAPAPMPDLAPDQASSAEAEEAAAAPPPGEADAEPAVTLEPAEPVQDVESRLAPPRALEEVASEPLSASEAAAPEARSEQQEQAPPGLAPHPEPSVPVWDEAFEAELQQPPCDDARTPLPEPQPEALPEGRRPAPAAPEPLPTARWDDSAGTPPPQGPAVERREPSASPLPEQAPEEAPQSEPPPEPTAGGEVPANFEISDASTTARWDEAAEPSLPETPAAAAWDEARPSEQPDAPQGLAVEGPADSEPLSLERVQTPEATPLEAPSDGLWPGPAGAEAPDAVPEAALAEPFGASEPEAAPPGSGEAAQPMPVEAMAPPQWEGEAEAAPPKEPALPAWKESTPLEEPEPVPERSVTDPFPVAEAQGTADHAGDEVASPMEWGDAAEVAPTPEPAAPLWDETFDALLHRPPVDAEPDPAPLPEPPARAFEWDDPVPPTATGMPPAPAWERDWEPGPPLEPAVPSWDESPVSPRPEPALTLAPAPLGPVAPAPTGGLATAVAPPPQEPLAAAYDPPCLPHCPEPSQPTAAGPAASAPDQERVPDREAPVSP